MHMLCRMVELLPSIGTTVPSPNVLTVVACQSESALQNVAKFYSNTPTSSSSAASNATSDFCSESQRVSKTYLISISDDGKIWSWLLTAEWAREAQITLSNSNTVPNASKLIVPESLINSVDSSVDKLDLDENKESHPVSGTYSCSSNATISTPELSFEVCKDALF